MGFNFNIGYNSYQPLSVERDRSGNWFYTMFSSKAKHKFFASDKDKIKAVLSNPYLMKCFALNADLFSIGRVDSANGEKTDVLKTIKSQPNFTQTWAQFFWDYEFYIGIGTAYLWKPYKAQGLNDTYPIQWLNPAKIDWDVSLTDKLKDLILTGKSLRELRTQTIKYNLDNGTTKLIPLDEIYQFYDLSNSMTDNFMRGASRLDSLYKTISNTEIAMDAKSKNLEYSKKFMVNGNNSIENISELPMGDEEKISIEAIANSSKDVHAVKTPITISRFVDDIANLGLDNSLNSDYLTIGTTLGIPKELLDVSIAGKNGSTYENQQKAIGRHVEYSLKPKANNLMEGFKMIFGLDLVMTWEHLMFNQVFEKEKAETVKIRLENAILAKENDLKLEDYEY